MSEHAVTDGICTICRGRIRRGEVVRDTGSHGAAAVAHVGCAATLLRSGTAVCACRHTRADHPVTEGDRCAVCSCVWFRDVTQEVDNGEKREVPAVAETTGEVVERAAGPTTDSARVRTFQTRQNAARILRTLVRGVNPGTGEVMPADGPFNEPNVLRALFMAVEALEAKTSPELRRLAGPANAGKPWSPEDHATLLELFETGTTVEDLAKQFARSAGAVTSRLVKYGRVEPDAIKGLVPNAGPRPPRDAA